MSSKTNADPKTWKNQFKCIVPACRSSTSTNIAKLHSFPWRDMPRAQKWMVAVGRLDLIGQPPKALLRLRVCDLHFDKKLRRGKNMKLFDNNAVPTLKLSTVNKSSIIKKLPRKRTKKEVVKTETNDGDSAEPTTDTAAEPSTGPGDVRGASAAGAGTPIRLPRELARFLALREKMHSKNTARKGFDRRFAEFALNLHLSCPEAYRVLWKSLRLPPPTLLPRVDLGVGTRLDSHLMRSFSCKMANLDPRDRECVLCLDELDLTERLFYVIDKDELLGLEDVEGELTVAPAARALVLAARGVRGGWTQPLGYFMLAEDSDPLRLVAPLRRLIVHALYGRARCAVRAVVSALGPTFAELSHALGVTVESPFVLDAAPRRRVCFLHDPEQLLLTLRDTLMAYDVRFRDPAGGAELLASWRHVEELHREDSARALRLLPELTRACVRPTPRESLRERHAAALFTRRVAAQLGAGAGSGDSKRTGTARLLLLAADAGRALRAPRPRSLARVASAAAALGAALQDMRIVSADGTEHDAEVFVRALRVTLAGALHLLSEAEGGDRDEPLRLARCGLRPVRRFIERAEGAHGRILPRELRRRFRRWTMRCLLTPVSTGTRTVVPKSCDDDLAALLRQAESLEEEKERESETTTRGEEVRHALRLGELDHKVNVVRAGSAVDVSVSLMRECRRAHGCSTFVRWSRDVDRGAALVRELDAAFKRAMVAPGPNAVGARTLEAVSASLMTRLPCPCFPRDTFCRLFVRFRLRAALQTYNRSLRGVSTSAPGSDRWMFR